MASAPSTQRRQRITRFPATESDIIPASQSAASKMCRCPSRKRGRKILCMLAVRSGRTTMNAPFKHPRLGRAAHEFLAAKHQLFIGGKWVDAKSGKTFDTFDPGTGLVIAQAAEGAAADVDAAVAAARAAFEGAWSKLTGSERAKLLWKLADLIEAHRDELAELESLNNGKPIANIKNSDLVNSAEVFRYMAGWTTKLTGETISLSQPGNFHAYTLRESVGVVGQIIPWNAPLMMAAWKLAPALAAGCTAVLKPAEQTPLTALRLGQLIQEAGFPDGVVHLVPRLC